MHRRRTGGDHRHRDGSRPTGSTSPTSRPATGRWRCACTASRTRPGAGATCCRRWPRPASTPSRRSCGATRRRSLDRRTGRYQAGALARRRHRAARRARRRRRRGAHRPRLGRDGGLRRRRVRAGAVAPRRDRRGPARSTRSRRRCSPTTSSGGPGTSSSSRTRWPTWRSGMDDLEFIARLWQDWSPGYDAAVDVDHVRDALGQPENLAAARRLLPRHAPARPAGAASWPTHQAACSAPTPQPTLYLHGADDGCMSVDWAAGAAAYLPAEGSRVEIVADAGHFLQLEQPEVVNRLIVEHLTGRLTEPSSCSTTRPSRTSEAIAARPAIGIVGPTGRRRPRRRGRAGRPTRSAATSRPRPWRSDPSNRDWPRVVPAEPRAGSGSGRPLPHQAQSAATGHRSHAGLPAGAHGGAEVEHRPGSRPSRGRRGRRRRPAAAPPARPSVRPVVRASTRAALVSTTPTSRS